ncbi:MAG TPA: division plane positioning ATPase MipZ [Caulobacteraceae bacterium]|jgi:chromosome partitioning protein
MPTIVFMSSKGGTGKTTAALTLALGLARRSERVAVIDADVNQPIHRWRGQATGPENLTVFPATTIPQMLQALEDARAIAPWLIVDTEGSPRAWDQVGTLKPDLVIIPVGPSPLEAAEAIRTSKSLQDMAAFFDRPLPHACVFTRLPAAIRARSFTQVVQQLRSERIAIIDTPLIEKEAFRAMFWNGGSLDTMDPALVSGLPAAQLNADQYAANIIGLFSVGGPLFHAAPAPPVQAPASAPIILTHAA